MKITAFILLLGFSTYLAETVDMPVNKCTSPDTCASAKKTTHCSGMTGGMCGMSHKNEPSKKPAKGCANSAICMDCPLCYNLMPVDYKSIAIITIFSKTLYIIHDVNLMPGYNSAQWKPPNAA